MEDKPLYIFEPQEDITTYELAWITKLLLAKNGAKVFEDMPQSCLRHMKAVE